METKTYECKYGVVEVNLMAGKRFFVVTDSKRTSLNYSNKDFALKKSLQFIKACHKNFYREQDQTQILFSFSECNYQDANGGCKEI